jgi:hypothetical protein
MGMELSSEDDQSLFAKSRLLGDLQMRSQEYNRFMNMEKYDMALDSLLIGVSRYCDYKEEAQSLMIGDEYDALGMQLEQQLADQFGISEEEAVSISGLTRENYSIRINEILEQLGLQ